jgi:hypothetical protein
MPSIVLVEKHNKLEEQYSFLWESTPQPSNTKNTSNPFTSQGCGKYYNLDLNVYYTNLANMEAIKKEIARLNAMLGERCMKDKRAATGKENQPKRPQYKDGRPPHIKDGLGYTKRAKSNERKVIKGYKYVQFMSKEKVGTDKPAQLVVQGLPRVAQPTQGGSAAVNSGSAAPHRKGKATSSFSGHVKAKKNVSNSK